MEHTHVTNSESIISGNRILLSTISRETVNDIYRSESPMLKKSIIETCLNASVEELQVLFKKLGPIGWELGNILCSEKGFVANLRTRESFVLFRKGVRITRLSFICAKEQEDKTKGFMGKVVKLKKQNREPKIVYKNGRPIIKNLVFYEYASRV